MAKTRPGLGRVNGCEVRSGLDEGSSLPNWARSGPLCVHIRSNVPGSAWGSGSNGKGGPQLSFADVSHHGDRSSIP